MVARSTGNLTSTFAYAKRGAAAAPSGLLRAQVHAWALLPTLAQQGPRPGCGCRPRRGADGTRSRSGRPGSGPFRLRRARTRPAPSRGAPHAWPNRPGPRPRRGLRGRLPTRHPRMGCRHPRPCPGRGLRDAVRRRSTRPGTSSTGYRRAACAPPPAPGAAAWTVCSPPGPPRASPTCANACTPCRLPLTRPAPHRRVAPGIRQTGPGRRDPEGMPDG